MARGPFNRDLKSEGDSIAEDLDEKAVENFSFDVSPSIRTDLTDTAQPSPPAPKSPRLPRREPASRPRTTEPKPRVTSPSEVPVPKAKHVETPGSLQNIVERPTARTLKPKKSVRSVRPSQRTPIVRAIKKHAAKKNESFWRRRPAWVVSLGVHSIGILALSLFSFAIAEPDNFLLWASPPPNEPIEEFQDIEIESPLELEELDTQLPTQLEDSGMASLGEVSADSVFNDLSATGPLSGDSIGEWGSLFGDQGSGLSDVGLGQGNALTSFFGTKSDARKVVFVIDNTGSMRTGGLETVIVEMMKTVEALDKRQEFYVLFFSDQVYPLFFPNSVSDFVHPTDKNKRKLRQWLDKVEFCTGGVWQLTQALDAAYKLKPDVVYLLTDGRHWDMVRADYKVEAVNNLRSVANPLGIPIHTLGMGCESNFDRANLAQVAQANGGDFREVEVSPAMIDVAYAKSRPYHIDGPGTIWGTLVRKRK